MTYLQAILEKELKRLQEKLCFGGDMTVKWLPDEVEFVEIHGEKKELGGKIEGSVIKIFETDKKEALWTLRHEFIENMIKTEFSEPYLNLANAIMTTFDNTTYQRQERIIEKLTMLMARVKKDNKKNGNEKSAAAIAVVKYEEDS